jgi:hypothetical protein
VSQDFLPKPTFSDNGLDEVEYETVASAYFQGVVGQGNAARQRAQAGFAIVSAIAGAVVAFSLSSTVSGSAGLTKAFTYASLGLWALCALLFLLAAILQPLSEPPTQAELDAVREFPTTQKPAAAGRRRRRAAAPAKEAVVAPGVEKGTAPVQEGVVAPGVANSNPLALRPVGFVDYVFRLAKGDAHRVSWWVVIAGATAAVAALALLGAAGGLLFDSPGPSQTNAIVTVTSPFFEQYEARCEVQPVDPALRDLVGQVADNSLTNGTAPYVDFQTAPGTCISGGHFIIPGSDVVSIEEYSCPLTDVAEVSALPDPVVACPDKATPFKDIYRSIAGILKKVTGQGS